MEYKNYYSLSRHVFVEDILKKSIEINKTLIEKPSLKVKVKYKRKPSEGEDYCLGLSYCLAHLLTVIQQLEHTILYMSNFSPTDSMKKIGINRSTHLLWSVENYIVRTQTIYDRLLILVDRLFHIRNQASQISHTSIVTNDHIKLTTIPNALKKVKSIIKKYYHDRNTIIHEASYLDDDLRRIEGISILFSNPDYEDIFLEDLNEELKWAVKEFVTKQKKEFSRINTKVCLAVGNVFSEMHPIYTKQCVNLNVK